MNQQGEYVAVCVQCDSQTALVPETEAEEWADEHRDVTGHIVLYREVDE